MTVYISLLRGINVSGQKIIKMADLRSLYQSLSFQHVKSYIQSGNLGSVELSRLNFVRDKSVLIAASSVQPSHSKQILLNKE